MKKTIYLLNINNYAPEITSITYPLIERWAKKVGSGIHIINTRKFTDWDMGYEKLQIYELSEKNGDDWSIYLDSDTVVHPELPDFTEMVPFDTVIHNGCDLATIRWKYDKYFRRDGRHIGSCNWFACASSWCTDLWRPLDDLTMEQAVVNITPTVAELNTVITAAHLIDDYVLSRNIARFGLKFVTLKSLWAKSNLEYANFFHHEYTLPLAEKETKIREIIKKWEL